MTHPSIIPDPRRPSYPLWIVAAVIFSLGLATAAPAAQPGDVLEQVAALAYGEPKTPPGDFALKALSKDPALLDAYFEALLDNDVGLDVKMSNRAGKLLRPDTAGPGHLRDGNGRAHALPPSPHPGKRGKGA